MWNKLEAIVFRNSQRSNLQKSLDKRIEAKKTETFYRAI